MTSQTFMHVYINLVLGRFRIRSRTWWICDQVQTLPKRIQFFPFLRSYSAWVNNFLISARCKFNQFGTVVQNFVPEKLHCERTVVRKLVLTHGFQNAFTLPITMEKSGLYHVYSRFKFCLHSQIILSTLDMLLHRFSLLYLKLSLI